MRVMPPRVTLTCATRISVKRTQTIDLSTLINKHLPLYLTNSNICKWTARDYFCRVAGHHYLEQFKILLDGKYCKFRLGTPELDQSFSKN